MGNSNQGLKQLRRNAGVAALVLGALLAGYLLRGGCRPVRTAEPAETDVSAKDVQWWTCSMHPQIHQPRPGLCPICNMELIPVKKAATEDAAGPRAFATTLGAIKLMEVETSPVERKFVTAEVRMVGKLDYDETRLGYITAWVAGRLDRLFVDYTGIAVRKGDHMVEIYSPSLLAAQEELLQAVRAAASLNESRVTIVRETTAETVKAAREKLRLMGLQPEQVEQIEKSGTVADHITLYASMSGIVIHKDAQEGEYVQVGSSIYTLASLDQLWLKLDAYESDLMWLRYGQKVSFTTEAYPGETFSGRIAFMEPFVNAKTRTVKVRVNVPNADGRLKPEMFVRAIVRADVAAEGRVIDESLAGKWVCPMHPDVVKAAHGTCDICGMDLVTAESLGYTAVTVTESAKPIVIPATAPLITGQRAIVYVETPGAKQPTFEGREVVLGPRAGDYYIVRDGLHEGERVVTQGAFKIDSALQIQARPSMMSPQGGAAPALHQHSGNMKNPAMPAMEHKHD